MASTDNTTAPSQGMMQVAGGVSLPTASTSMDEERRPQAGPLPSKVGEIGYSSKLHGMPQRTESPVADLPARHPADRDHRPSSSSSRRAPSSDDSHAGPNPNPSSSSLPRSSSSTHSTRTLLSFLKPARMNKPLPSFKGMRAASIIRFFTLLATLAATIAGWVEIVIHLNAVSASFGGSFDPSSNSTSTSNSTFSGDANSTDSSTTASNFAPDGTMASTTFIFIHVAFAVAVIFQLLFLERAVFQLRAERYMHLHPQAAAAYRANPHARAMGLAPWARPPLPTYAAALGVRGTGDVEDNIIAAPPPPAYGNTRGSTLLLAGFIRDSLRGRLPPDAGETTDERRGSHVSSTGATRATTANQQEQPSNGRPVSYGTSELEDSANRARHLEAALSRLEDGQNPL